MRFTVTRDTHCPFPNEAKMRAFLCHLLFAGLLVSLGCARKPSPEAVAAGGKTQPGKATRADQSGKKATLVVLRGEKVGVRYPIYEGVNYLGRADQLPVDIDFDDQEPANRIWTSRQHATITCEGGKLFIEDLKSANGTFVNRQRVFPGKKQQLAFGDILQLGSVVMKLVANDDQEKIDGASARKARLVVVRGLKIGTEYPIYEGANYLGRADELSVDIDLDDQESADRVWTSRQHAIVHHTNGKLFIEDLKSANGTFVNRARIKPGDKVPLKENDLLQLGTVQMKVVVVK